MTKDELIEVTARVIYEADDPWHKAWPWPDLQSDQAGVDQYRRIAEAALAVIAPAVLDLALDDVATDRTIEKHGAHCRCITCELNIAEDGIRALKERFV